MALALGVLALVLAPAAHAECVTDADCEEGAECVEVFEDCSSGEETGEAGTDGDAGMSTESEASDGRKNSCAPRWVCWTPPAPPLENRCASGDDCPEGFLCTDLGAEHDVCAPPWMTLCDGDTPCGDGLACERAGGRLCVPPSGWGCDAQFSPERCPTGYTCRFDIMDLCFRPGDEDCAIEPRYVGRGHGGVCRPDRAPCDDEAPCDGESTCGPDRTQRGVEADQDLFCEPLPSEGGLNPMACEEAWFICVPDRDAEYMIFRALGRIAWPAPAGGDSTDVGAMSGEPTPGGSSADEPGGPSGPAPGSSRPGSDPGDSSAGEPTPGGDSAGEPTPGGEGTPPSGSDPSVSAPSDSGAPTGSEDPGAGPGADDDAPSSGGGGCAAAGASAPLGSAWALLALLGLVAVRRRSTLASAVA